MINISLEDCLKEKCMLCLKELNQGFEKLKREVIYTLRSLRISALETHINFQTVQINIDL